ncbi:MAG: metal-sulfur cluster assembly factor [Propionibacterium sp.]|nr:metal-sulfur cluster assembly factor [Propionibacterium sp.]
MSNPSDLVRDELPGTDPVPATWATASEEERKLVIFEALKEVVDPELMVNIVDLGLVYDALIDDDLNVTLNMTLTSPACPLTDQIEWETQAVLGQLARSVTVNWVWMPPWSIEMITDDGREQLQALGFMI